MPSNITSTISLSRKINLGNYESADVFISIGGISQETTAEEVVALLDGPAKESFEILKVRLAAQVTEARQQRP